MAPKRKVAAASGDLDDGGAGPGPSSERQRQRQQQQPSQAQPSPTQPTQAPPAAPTPGRGGPVVKPSRAEVGLMRKKIAVYHQRAKAERDKITPLLAKLPVGEPEGGVGRVMRVMIFHHAQKPNEAVTRTVLIEAVKEGLKNLNQLNKLPAYVIAEAQHRMISELGLEMLELIHHGSTAAAAAAFAAGPGGEEADGSGDDQPAAAVKVGGTKLYKLHSVLPAPLLVDFVQNRTEDPRRGMHMAVLGMILLQGDTLEYEALVNLLRTIGIDDNVTHPHFDTLDVEIKNMLQKKYLKVHSAATSDAGLVYEWGDGATNEFQPIDVKTFMDKEFKFMDERLQAAPAPEPDRGQEEDSGDVEILD